MTMHFLPDSHITTAVNWMPAHRGRRRTLMLAGFAPAEAVAMGARLRGAGVPRVVAAPVHEALAHLLDDPGDFSACILDARAFADDEALSDALRLLSIEPGGFRVIVVHHHAPGRLTMGDRHRSTLDVAMGAVESAEDIAALAGLCMGARPDTPLPV